MPAAGRYPATGWSRHSSADSARTVVGQPGLGAVDVAVDRWTEALVEREHERGVDPPDAGCRSGHARRVPNRPVAVPCRARRGRCGAGGRSVRRWSSQGGAGCSHCWGQDVAATVARCRCTTTRTDPAPSARKPSGEQERWRAPSPATSTPPRAPPLRSSLSAAVPFPTCVRSTLPIGWSTRRRAGSLARPGARRARRDGDRARPREQRPGLRRMAESGRSHGPRRRAGPAARSFDVRLRRAGTRPGLDMNGAYDRPRWPTTTD